MKTEAPAMVPAATGEKIPFTKEETEYLHLSELNAVLRGMSSHQIEAAIAKELEPHLKDSSGWRVVNATPVELYNARQEAIRNLAEKELARQIAENAAREVAKGTPDEQARARVLRIHQRKLDVRLATMTPEQRKAYEADLAVCHAGIASAQVRKATDEIRIFSERLSALEGLPPAEDDLDALLEPEGFAWGIDGQAHATEVERLRKKHNLDENNQPQSTTRRAPRK